MTGFRADGAPVKAMKHLAENGPTERDALAAHLRELDTSESNVHNVMCRLREAGFITTKVWLTPAGLAELRRLGWTLDLAGVAEETAA
jgi:hypothetical protein